ncbi:hypothetical protein KJ766_00420 [Patescibacteria group bacterium]|nr:hypothetical protein [Patescibacteria group bacterium]
MNVLKKVSSLLTAVAMLGGFFGSAAFASAETVIAPGDLVKGSSSTVYYYGVDGNRYNFPNENTYFTWYENFDDVVSISDSTLSTLSLVGNVTYKPGTRMLKIQSDPKVYAIQRGGELRWVTSESVASGIYGSNWNQYIDDISVAFFPYYNTGEQVDNADDYAKSAQEDFSSTIDIDKGLVSGPYSTPGTPTLSDPGSTVVSGAAVPLSWTSATNAVRYRIERATSNSFLEAEKVYSGSSLSATDYLVASSTTNYYYRVAAINPAGQGSWSSVQDIILSTSGVPDVPTLSDPGTSISSGTLFDLDVSASSGATSYVIQQSTNSSFSSYIQIYSGSLNSYTHSIEVSSDDDYYFRAQAKNSTGDSGWSNVVDLTITAEEEPEPEPEPTAPDAPTMTDPGDYALTGTPYDVDWSSETDATFYCYQYASNEDFNGAVGICSIDNTTLSMAGRTTSTSLTTYYYRVMACNTIGCSDYSNVVDMTVSTRPITYASDFGGDINLALSSTPSGGTVYVEGGSHVTGTIIVPTGVALIGAGPETTTINANNDPFGVILQSDTILQGFTITNAGIDLVTCASSINSLIQNNVLIARDIGGIVPGGISLTGAYNIQIFNNTIIDETQASVMPTSGIYTDASPMNYFEAQNNLIDGFAQSIMVLGGMGISDYNAAYSPIGAMWLGLPQGANDVIGQATYSSNYTLRTGSLGLNIGNPSSTFTDIDGTRNDMGAYGGPNSSVYFLVP